MSKILDYDQFIEHIGNEKLYKLFPKLLKCHDIQYRENAEFKIDNFDHKECTNGIHFTTQRFLCTWILSRDDYYICEIIPDKSSKYVILNDKIKTNFIKISSFDILSEFIINHIELFSNDILLLFKWSCSNGCLDIIKYLYENIKSCELIANLNKTNDNLFVRQVFSSVIIYNHIDILQYLCEIIKIDKNIFKMDFCHLCNNACRYGYINIVKYLHKNLEFTKEYFQSNNNMACQLACIYGHINIVKYFHQEIGFTDKNDFQSDDKTPLWQMTLHYGQLDIVKYLQEAFQLTKIDFETENIHDSLCIRICDNNHLNAIKYLHQDLGFTKEDFQILNNRPCKIACANNYVNIVKYLYENIGLTKEDFESDNNYVYRQAMSNNYIDIATYLRDVVGVVYH